MSVSPQFIGQRYKDSNTGNIYNAKSITPGDWGLELQNMLYEWLPLSASLGDLIPLISNYGELSGITYLLGKQAHLTGINIGDSPGPTEIHFPNLVDVDAGNNYSGEAVIAAAPGVTIVDFPLLSAVGYRVDIDSNDDLVTVLLPSLVNLGNSNVLLVNNNSKLTTVDISALLPAAGAQLKFDGCALSAATVNHILARCVASAGFNSGLVDTHLGTSAAPTGQGIADKATLNARHAGLAVTN